MKDVQSRTGGVDISSPLMMEKPTSPHTTQYHLVSYPNLDLVYGERSLHTACKLLKCKRTTEV